MPSLAAPTPDLEQYQTPARIAADLLYRALGRGDIEGRRVVDLGCGSGVFLAGAGLLGAASLTGIEVDSAAAQLATRTLADFSLTGDVHNGDVTTLDGEYDTAIMNPPFGAQFAARHLDTLFLQQALRVAPVCYSLHLSETEPHLRRVANELEAGWDLLARYDFPLPRQFAFHSKEKLLVPVALYRFERMGRT